MGYFGHKEKWSCGASYWLCFCLITICCVSWMLPLDLWTINADVMLVRSASEKVSDMKDYSYLNL